MKKTSEIIGLPIVDLSTGNQLGTVHDLLINEEKGSADYFIVDDGLLLLGARVIDARDVKGIGEYALTVAKKEAVKDIIRVDAAVNLYKKKIKVKNTKVLTQQGKLVGETGDVYIGEKDCMISALEFIPYDKKDKARLIRREGIVTFGENLVVVRECVSEITDIDLNKDCIGVGKIENDESKLLRQYEMSDKEVMYKEPLEAKSIDITRAPAKQSEAKNITKKEQSERKVIEQAVQEKELHPAPSRPKAAKQEEIKEIVTDKDINEEDIANSSFEEGISAKNVYYRPGVKQYEIHKKQAADNIKKEQPKSSELFEMKQREYLLGRKVTKEISDKMGNSILSIGDLITEEAMNKAKDAGRFIELVMNNKP
ncbi:MAG: PRC-barrel domain-containing protein [Ignavibacteriales bacterium]